MLLGMHVCLLLFHPQGLQMYPHVVEPFINIWLQIPAIQNSIHAVTMASLSQKSSVTSTPIVII